MLYSTREHGICISYIPLVNLVYSYSYSAFTNHDIQEKQRKRKINESNSNDVLTSARAKTAYIFIQQRTEQSIHWLLKLP